ncbi:trace amine-associated receptor 13c-like [Amphibalanus amphitrite]|nr:trace amine-associated receptor 13c-like [Amphibalanus amphitrite]
MAIAGGVPEAAARAREARPQSDLEAWRSLLSIFSNYSSVLDEWVEKMLEEAKRHEQNGEPELWIMNKPAQSLCICVIITAAVILNICVIQNIYHNDLKLKTVHFLLIKNLCIVDLIGALCVLPVPLITTMQGEWTFGEVICSLNSIINVLLWLQHIIMFIMLKIDRVLASCLPIGKYPLFPIRFISFVVMLSWLFSFSVAVFVTTNYDALFEPAIILCIPDLPSVFFIFILVIYCLALFTIIVGYVLVAIFLRRKQVAASHNPASVHILDYRGLERTAMASFLVTLSHLVLYIPTLLVIGLHGWILPPIGILICDMIVYSEFFIHPVILLATSTRMRKEVRSTLRRLRQSFSRR